MFNPDDVFLRVGDRSKKLNFEQRLQLVYAKGVRYFEDQSVYGASVSDIDWNFVRQYIEKIGYTKGSADFYMRHNHDFITTVDGEDRISGAAILLFGVNPQRFFPRARIRFIRYEGKTAEVGDRMNVVKDLKFSGRILEQVQEAISFMKTQIREYTSLKEGAVFKTIPEYPEFCWTELIVNAVAHRDYSIKGTDIQIKMFDDHLCVESPGILPGMVRIDNIREFHFSRNPKIVELLNEYDLVKEFGEGVDRVYRDMKDAGLPEPHYKQSEYMLYAELRNKTWGHIQDTPQDTPQDEEARLLAFCSQARSRQEIMEYMDMTDRKYFNRRYLKPLVETGKLRMTLPEKPTSKYQKYIAAVDIITEGELGNK